MAQAEKDGIEIDQVSFARKGRPILNRIDLKVGRRELVGLIGPNGAGKSSLLKLLVKLLTPGAGSIRVDGKELNEFLPRELARRIAYLPQGPVIEKIPRNRTMWNARERSRGKRTFDIGITPPAG